LTILTQKLSSKVKLSFALPALPLAMLGIHFYVFIPKYLIDFVGLSGFAIGAIILFSRLWDAFLDPLIGYLSDSTQSRFGRRLPWITIGCFGVVTSFILITAPISELFVDSNLLLVSYGLLTFLFFLFWTMFLVPFQALGAELSDSYFERSKLFAWRDGAMVLGTICAVILPAIMGGVHSWKQSLAIGIFYSLILIICFSIFLRNVKEKAHDVVLTSTIYNPIKALSSLKNNKPFVTLAIAYLIAGFGSQLPSTLFLFYVDHVLKDGSGPLLLLLYFVVGFLFIPVWERVARNREKRDVWIAAMAVNAGSFIMALFLGAGDVNLFALVVCISGIGYGATLFLPSSMQADVIEYDFAISGERREGLLSGGWLIASKLSGALGAGIALPLVDLFGYKPGVEQSNEVVGIIKILYAGVPCLCYAIAIGVALRYPLTYAQYKKIVKKEVEG